MQGRNYLKESIRSQSLWSYFEVIIITLIFLGIVIFLHAQDPFFLKGPIPWILFVPLVIGLFYGMIHGFLSLLLIFATFFYWILHGHYHWDANNVTIIEYLFGSILITFIAGEFSYFWKRRVALFKSMSSYIQNHLDSLSRTYYAMRISHDHIEHSYIIKPTTLRDVLLNLRQYFLEDTSLNSKSAEQILLILSQFCSYDQAALLTAKDGKIQEKPLAYVGDAFNINLNDPLIERTLVNKKTNYVAVNDLQNEMSEYLVSIPMMTSEGLLVGLILIYKMPFWALNQENLEILSALAGYISNEYWNTSHAQDFLKCYPNCPSAFASELYKLTYMKKKYEIDSGLVAIIIPERSDRENILIGLEKMQRSLDAFWHDKINNSMVFFTLLPFTTAINVQGYLARIKNWFKIEHGIDLDDLNKAQGIYIRYQQVTAESPIKNLNELIEKCNIE